MTLLDPYLARRSILHRLDPRAKLLGISAVVAAAVLAPAESWLLPGLYFLLLAGLAALARLPVTYFLRRILITLPFVLPAVLFIPFLQGGGTLGAIQLGGWHVTLSRTGLEFAGVIVAKSWLSVMALALLAATTRINDLLSGLEKLRAPRIMTALLGFTFRYIFVLTDEARRLKAGRDIRYFSNRTGPGIRSVGHMAGSLFLRSYARGERVYGAMLLRGYDGASRSLNPLKFMPADLAFILGVISIIIILNISLVWT